MSSKLSSTCEKLTDSIRWFYQGRVAFQFIKILSECIKVGVYVLINWLSLRESFWCGAKYAFSLRKREFKTMNEPQKAAPEIKESNYSHQLNIERNMSHSCTVQRTLLFFHRLSVCVRGCNCVHWWARICVCVNSPVLPIGSLKLHSLLSGLSSQQGHLEISFKTAINTEFWRKKSKEEVFRNCYVGVWAKSKLCVWKKKRHIERFNGSD